MSQQTLESIAKLAGVSRSTVSRVVNRHPSVSPDVRDRVTQIIKTTGYRPNSAARKLRSNRSQIIGLVFRQNVNVLFADPFFPRLTQGITRVCNESEYSLMLFVEGNEDKLFDLTSGRGMFDGLIVQTVSIHDSLIPRLLRRQIPVVVSGRPAQDIRATYVDADNENGAYLAVRHLLKLGRRKISVITGEMTSTSSIDRLDGYKRALREFDIPYDKRLVHESDYLMEGGYQATSVLIKQNPDAIFAFSDTMARGALRALADRGISVPEQISVIGFDDLPPATNERPMLTTVRQPVRQAGQKLVELLLNKISNGSHSTEQVIFDTELIVRETCGGAA